MKKGTISIISGEKEEWFERVIEEGRRMGVKVEIISPWRMGGEEEWGEVVIWRGSGALRRPWEKGAWVERIKKDRVVMNERSLVNPLLGGKFYQQAVVKACWPELALESWWRASKKEMKELGRQLGLSLPLVMKENVSSKGQGVYLIREEKDWRGIKEMGREGWVGQEWVEGEGDYRVLVLGGVALGVMKRVAKSGEWRNNVALGGRVVAVKGELAEELQEWGERIASGFGLEFVGVDLIRDRQGRVRFLEINTIPGFGGFERATGVNVVRELVRWGKLMIARKRQARWQVVKDYLDSYWPFLGDKGSHYLIRKKLLLGEEVKREELEGYLGARGEFEELARRLVGEKWLVRKWGRLDEERRAILQGKRRELLFWEEVLVRMNFGRVLFGEDYGKEVERVRGREELVRWIKWLEKDERSWQVLSSMGVNVVVLGRKWLGWQGDEKRLMAVWRRMGENDEQEVTRKLYFWTHMVIGKSDFYGRELGDREKKVLGRGVRTVERLGREWWGRLSVDVRLEAALAARMVGRKVSWEEFVIEEAEASLSSLGNYVDDRLKAVDSLRAGEHRSVLYLGLMKRSGRMGV